MVDFLFLEDPESIFLSENALNLPKEAQNHLVFDYYLAFFLPVLQVKR